MFTSVNSISSKTITSIVRIVTLDGKPHNMKNQLISDIKLRIKLLKMSSKKDYLTTCLDKSLATPEIISLAKKIVSETMAKERQMKEERRIIRYRIDEKIGQIADYKHRINCHMKNIKKDKRKKNAEFLGTELMRK